MIAAKQFGRKRAGIEGGEASELHEGEKERAALLPREKGGARPARSLEEK